MDNHKIGILGYGKMGHSIGQALVKKGRQVYGVDRNASAQKRMQADGVSVSTFQEVWEVCDSLILAVKPQSINAILGGKNGMPAFSRPKPSPSTKQEIRDAALDAALGSEPQPPSSIQHVVSIMAGVSTDSLRHKGVPENIPIVRIMPNMPCRVYQGASVWYVSGHLDTNVRAQLIEDIQALSPVAIELGSEELMHIGTGVSGSGPAYAYLFLVALTDWYVLMGKSVVDAIWSATRAMEKALEHTRYVLFDTDMRCISTPLQQRAVFMEQCLSDELAFSKEEAKILLLIDLMLEGLALAGVQGGLSMAHALALAWQTLWGAVALCVHENKIPLPSSANTIIRYVKPTYPASLRDEIMSPGGTTAAGVGVLTERGFTAAVWDVMNSETLTIAMVVAEERGIHAMSMAAARAAERRSRELAAI